jgi:hypothetical protein
MVLKIFRSFKIEPKHFVFHIIEKTELKVVVEMYYYCTYCYTVIREKICCPNCRNTNMNEIIINVQYDKKVKDENKKV